MHQQLIFDAAGSVGGQPDALVRAEGADGLDQPDRADRDQVILFGARRIVFFHDVRHQPQIVFDQLRAGVFVAFLLHFPQQFGLFLRRQRLGKRAVRALHPQDQEEECAAQRKKGGKQHNMHLSFVRYRYFMRGIGCPMPQKIGLVICTQIHYNMVVFMAKCTRRCKQCQVASNICRHSPSSHRWLS